MRFVISLGFSAFILFMTGAQSGSSNPISPISIQDRNTVRTLYGSPTSEIYQTPQKLTVTASFAPNGSLCRADIRPGNGAEITDKQLNDVLDKLAPKEVRGEYKMGTFLNITCLKQRKPENPASDASKTHTPELEIDPCAECSGVSEDYQRATITKYGNTNRYSSVHIRFKQAECEEPEKTNP